MQIKLIFTRNILYSELVPQNRPKSNAETACLNQITTETLAAKKSRDTFAAGKCHVVMQPLRRTFPIHCLSTAQTLNSFLESIDTGRAVL